MRCRSERKVKGDPSAGEAFGYRCFCSDTHHAVDCTWTRRRSSLPILGCRFFSVQGAFTATAEALVTAADRRDCPDARRSLQQLAAQCAACHKEHR